ncbi:MAG: tetratricopeptide repeat protein [Desulfatiglandaceae bacterium]
MASESWWRWVRIGMVLLWLGLTLGYLAWRNPMFWMSAHQHYLQAQEYASACNWELARRHMDLALEKSDHRPGYLIYAGHLLLARGQPREARDCFEKVLSRDPGNLQARFGVAQVLLALGRQRKMRVYLNGLKDLGVSGRIQRARLYARIFHYEKSFQDFRSVIRRENAPPRVVREAVISAVGAGKWVFVLRTTRGRVPGLSRKDNTKACIHQVCVDLQDQKVPVGPVLEKPGQWLTTAGPAGDEDGPDPCGQTHYRINTWAAKAAFALRKGGRTDDAVRVYRWLQARGALVLRDRVRFAWLLNTLGDHAKAWTVLEDLPAPSSDVAVLEVQARTAYWLGKWGLAARLLEELLRHKNHFPLSENRFHRSEK